MATDYTRLPNTIGKPTEGELSVAEQEDGGLFDTGEGTTGVGAPGTEGPKGDTGDAGATGPQGDPGPQGPRGYQGVSIEGPTGPEGDKGDTGLTGDTGIDGATGPNGPKGDTGTSGTDGTDGSTGPTGPEGPKGDIGATGTSVTGPAGPQGPKGDTGDASTVVGPTGPPGVQGPTGSSGNEGPKGDMGTQGETGGVGPEGPQGVQGMTGMTGGTGSTGLTGATGPSGPEGDIGPTGARGIEGPKGQTGDKGDTGVQGASVTGEKGATGAVGPSGPEGDVGADSTVAGPPGLDGTNGTNGTDGTNGTNGTDGTDGTNGTNGADGIGTTYTAGENITIVDDVISSISDGGIAEYLDTETYEVGDVVWLLSDSNIYRNTTAITVGEEFDPTKWSELSPSEFATLQNFPSFRHSGATGVTTQITPGTEEINTLTYSGTTATAIGPAVSEETDITYSGVGSVHSMDFLLGESGVTNNIGGIAYGAGVAVAPINTGDVITSTDGGVTWSTISVSTAETVSTITYGNGTFVAAGSNGFTAVSTDSINWTGTSIPDAGSLSRSAFSNNLFFVWNFTSSGLELYVSSDGVNWVSADLGAHFNFNYDITYGNGVFVAVGVFYVNNIIQPITAKSTDGISWTGSNTGLLAGDALLSVVYANGLFVTVGREEYSIYTSEDGDTWTLRKGNDTNITTRTFRKIVYSDNLFVTVGNNGRIYSSEDGLTWTQRSSGTSSSLYDVANNGDLWVAVGLSGDITTSPDGTSWSLITSPTSNGLGGVIVANNDFIITGLTGTIIYSNPTSTRFSIILDTAHANTPITGSFTSEPTAIEMAEQTRTIINEEITAGNVTGLTVKPGTNEIVELDSATAGERVDINVAITGGTGSTASVQVVTQVQGSDTTTNTIQDVLTISNVDTTNGHTISSSSATLGFSLTGDALRDTISTFLEALGGYTIATPTSGTITFTSDTPGDESDVVITLTQAFDSTAVISNTITQGTGPTFDGALTEVTYTIQGQDYTVTFPSGTVDGSAQVLHSFNTIVAQGASGFALFRDSTDLYYLVNSETVTTTPTVVVNDPGTLATGIYATPEIRIFIPGIDISEVNDVVPGQSVYVDGKQDTITAGTDLTFAGNTLNYTGSAGSAQVIYWTDYVGGIPGDSIIVDSNTEVIPYNNNEYYREIQSEPYVDRFYQTRIGEILETLLATRGSNF